MADVTKAIIPIAGLATRFLPLSKVMPKELLPLGAKPMVQYALQELKAAGVKEVVFVVGTNKKLMGDYVKKAPQLEKVLEERKQEALLVEVRALEKVLDGITFSFVAEQAPLGDGHAILQAKRLNGDDPCFVLYPDDVIEAKVPCSAQLAHVFKTSQKPIAALCRMPKDKISAYGVAQAEKIASRLWKIKKIVEKPSPETAPSDLAMVGRWVITPEVFDYLKKAKPNKKGEVVLNEVLADMLKEGKIVYGYEFEGRWWECGDKKKWLKSHLYFSLKDPEFGKDLQAFVKEEKLV